ncbi:tonb-dependent receptor plug [Flammeovirgaceae bacterium 311]|nr:tonb-dependent receptor plug [Flammeovirgaceae bacterium 311]
MNKINEQAQFFYFTTSNHFKKYILIMLLLCPLVLCGQTVRLSGVVKDSHGETLPFAAVLVLPDSTIAPADVDGKFSAKVPGGSNTILISYTGFNKFRQVVQLRQDTTITFRLSPLVDQLQEVVITANRYSQQDLVQTVRTGTHTISRKDVEFLPVLGGEADVIKTLQLLPGTTKGVEGSSDLFVRGGAADQNLVLLDGAPIYNTSHLFGFLSVFNPDILEKVEAINGGFPAEFGGRLSSIIDISTNNTIAKKTSVKGEVGLLASRLYVEQPLVKGKASIWMAGRRTYVDQVVKAIDEELPYYFYDLNGKILFKLGRRDQIDISYYGGEDIFDLYRDKNNDGRGVRTTYASGNSSQSLQWRHRYDRGWNSDLTLTRSSYKYDIKNIYEKNELLAFSDIEDLGAKVTFVKDSVWKDAQVKAGIEWARHAISPSIVNSAGNIAEMLESGATGGKIANEISAYVQQEWSLTDKLLINSGIRGSFGLVNNKEYFTPEPRVSLRYALPKQQSLKLSYSRMVQYLHRISNSAVSTPTDIWYPVTDSIRPQYSHQVSAAWQKFLNGPKVFISAEGYYKTLSNLIGYEEGTNLFFNSDFQSKLIQGRGRAYGTEFLIRKEAGKLTGWLSYTLSWSWRQYDQINQGEWFPARYDRRHNGAVVMQYALGRRWSASMVWEYISGARFTPVIGQYIVPSPTSTGVDLIPVFSGINAVKMSDTHRLDLGLKFTSNPHKKIKWHMFAGVNNVYNRASPIGIFIEQDENDGSLKYTQPGLFGLLPFLNIGFSL